MRYALIGKTLVHSLSKEIHGRMGLSYDLVELREEEVADFVENNDYDGYNVTIPYKETVAKLVVIEDDLTASLGVVNTVVKRDGVSYGYNTDVLGMEYSFAKNGVDVSGKNVLVLGSGGTSKTATALCNKKGAKKISVCSRKGEINYSNVYELCADTEIIINCTPIGTYPDVEGRIIEVGRFAKLLFAYDCVYNPDRTNLILDAEENGIKGTNGLPMLVAQGLKAEELWLNKRIDEDVYDEMIEAIRTRSLNIVLVGMPGCGKSSVGKELALVMGREFYDGDTIIADRYGSPSDIITQKGEGYFRNLEREVYRELSEKRGVIIATGGGSVTVDEVVRNLKRTGKIVFIDTPTDILATDGRPLSQSIGVDTLYTKRLPLYNKAMDYRVVNDHTESILALAKEIEEIV